MFFLKSEKSIQDEWKTSMWGRVILIRQFLRLWTKIEGKTCSKFQFVDFAETENAILTFSNIDNAVLIQPDAERGAEQAAVFSASSPRKRRRRAALRAEQDRAAQQKLPMDENDKLWAKSWSILFWRLFRKAFSENGWVSTWPTTRHFHPSSFGGAVCVYSEIVMLKTRIMRVSSDFSHEQLIYKL